MTLLPFATLQGSCSTTRTSPPANLAVEVPPLPHWEPLGDTSCIDDFYLVCLDTEQTRVLNDNILRLTAWAKQCEVYLGR